MATLLWGKVYFHAIFAGILREEPGDRVTFTYDETYISANYPAIAHTLPVQKNAHISDNGLHPFFENLVSEGWLEQAQRRLIGKRAVKRFELLLAFGFDCTGAVSVIDPDPSDLSKAMLDLNDPKEMIVLTSRASLSGVQAKLPVVLEKGIFRPTHIRELSTHIAKFPSPNNPNLIENEYLTTCGFKALLPDDDCVELQIGSITGVDEPALLIKRFDRDLRHGDIKRLHFEEFNQLLGLRSHAKYTGAYRDMSDFILQSPHCLPAQTYTLYRRVMAGLLLGNTDMHFKNFAMRHTQKGYQFTPTYDQVAASLYQYKTVALAIANTADLPIGHLKPANIIRLGEEFGLSQAAITMAVHGLHKNIAAAKQAIADAPFGSSDLKNNLINLMEKRWNGTFALIGQTLSKKQSSAGKSKN
jgi:serine/threonine-protein kinase HipA